MLWAVVTSTQEAAVQLTAVKNKRVANQQLKVL